VEHYALLEGGKCGNPFSEYNVINLEQTQAVSLLTVFRALSLIVITDFASLVNKTLVGLINVCLIRAERIE